MSTNVTKLFPEETYYAMCNECGSIEWNLRTDGVGKDWKKLLGSECAECGFFVEWVVHDISEET